MRAGNLIERTRSGIWLPFTAAAKRLALEERGLLATPRSAEHVWTADNWGTNPASTIGTSVTPGSSNSEGSFTQLLSGATVANDVYGFYLQVHSGATSGQAKNQLLDIGVDPAGGTSYTAVISNLQIGAAPALTAAGAREHFFPLFIRAGSSVAARIQGSNATAGTVTVLWSIRKAG